MKKLIYVLSIIIIMSSIVYKVNAIVENNKIQEQKEIENYKQCIIKQSETRGWIIRSECASNYQELDKKANLEYTSKGYDLFLKK